MCNQINSLSILLTLSSQVLYIIDTINNWVETHSTLYLLNNIITIFQSKYFKVLIYNYYIYICILVHILTHIIIMSNFSIHELMFVYRVIIYVNEIEQYLWIRTVDSQSLCYHFPIYILYKYNLFIYIHKLR